MISNSPWPRARLLPALMLLDFPAVHLTHWHGTVVDIDMPCCIRAHTGVCFVKDVLNLEFQSAVPELVAFTQGHVNML